MECISVLFGGKKVDLSQDKQNRVIITVSDCKGTHPPIDVIIGSNTAGIVPADSRKVN